MIEFKDWGGDVKTGRLSHTTICHNAVIQHRVLLVKKDGTVGLRETAISDNDTIVKLQIKLQ